MMGVAVRRVKGDCGNGVGNDTMAMLYRTKTIIQKNNVIVF